MYFIRVYILSCTYAVRTKHKCIRTTQLQNWLACNLRPYSLHVLEQVVLLQAFVYFLKSQPFYQNPRLVFLQKNASFPTRSAPQIVQHTAVLHRTSCFQLHKYAFVVLQRNKPISLCFFHGPQSRHTDFPWCQPQTEKTHSHARHICGFLPQPNIPMCCMLLAVFLGSLCTCPTANGNVLLPTINTPRNVKSLCALYQLCTTTVLRESGPTHHLGCNSGFSKHITTRNRPGKPS